jgi:hypothetical protein
VLLIAVRGRLNFPRRTIHGLPAVAASASSEDRLIWALAWA